MKMNIDEAIKQLTKLNGFVNEYYKISNLTTSGNKLNELLQKITSLLYYLESVRSDIHDQFQIRISELIKDGNSVARAENIAHVEYPAMYQFRRIMDAGYKVTEAIRSNLSWIKSEINNSK